MALFRKIMISAALVLASMSVVGQSVSPTTPTTPPTNPSITSVSTTSGKITWYATGWGGAGVGVQTSAPVVNPGACQFADLYVTDPTDPANRMHQAALLTAYSLGRSVQISIAGCSSLRPMITGVVVLPT